MNQDLMTDIKLNTQQHDYLPPSNPETELELSSLINEPEISLEPITKIRTVVIEDHELTRIGIRTALMQHENIEVIGEAANATLGLQLLQNLQPDIVIVDIFLPDKDGIELTREIKLIARKKSIKVRVLILTLCDQKEAVLAAFAAGADSYCMKDIKFDSLLEAIRVTYDGNTWIDPTIARIVLEQAQKTPFVLDKASFKTQKLATKNSSNIEDDEMIDLFTLTERESEVLQLIVEGYNNAAIATRLYITVGTVKSHVRNVLNKLCADDRTQAAVSALRRGLVEL
ncbi:response regulator [Tolypothrix sp. PCC 7601]|nr:response regulator [Tolypothrix sp. PCC 7601]BAY91306.1 LuxR family two component transcriptional regulator [Microchaete diplosiphon NIES-3275]